MFVTKGRFNRHCDACHERIIRIEDRLLRLEEIVASGRDVYVDGLFMPTRDAVQDIAEHLKMEIKPSNRLRLCKK